MLASLVPFYMFRSGKNTFNNGEYDLLAFPIVSKVIRKIEILLSLQSTDHPSHISLFPRDEQIAWNIISLKSQSQDMTHVSMTYFIRPHHCRLLTRHKLYK